jgi:hypothetical protein
MSEWTFETMRREENFVEEEGEGEEMEEESALPPLTAELESGTDLPRRRPASSPPPSSSPRTPTLKGEQRNNTLTSSTTAAQAMGRSSGYRRSSWKERHDINGTVVRQEDVGNG